MERPPWRPRPEHGLPRSAVDQAIENLRVVQNRYEAGSSANIEVLDAETLRQQALNNRDNARYELALAKAAACACRGGTAMKVES